MKTLAILGASGHGKVIADIAESLDWEACAFFDDRWPQLSRNGPWSVVGDTDALKQRASDYEGLIIAIGDNATREIKMDELYQAEHTIVSVIHESACISKHSHIGDGSVVMPKAVVNVDAEIQNGAIINTAAVIEHDCQLGHFVHISPGAHLAGNVTVGDRSWVGIGACVKQGIVIGKDCVIGAGAVVIRDVPDGSVVVGNPAEVLGAP